MDFGTKAKLKCNKPRVLIGEEVVVCNNGTWSSSFNICASKRFDHTSNSLSSKSR
jgi:hypothetical protein